MVTSFLLWIFVLCVWSLLNLNIKQVFKIKSQQFSYSLCLSIKRIVRP